MKNENIYLKVDDVEYIASEINNDTITVCDGCDFLAEDGKCIGPAKAVEICHALPKYVWKQVLSYFSTIDNTCYTYQYQPENNISISAVSNQTTIGVDKNEGI